MGKRSRQRKNSPPVAAEESRAHPSKTALWAISAALAAAVFIVYGQCASHPFLRLDDPDFIVDNPHINTGLTVANIISAFTTVYASNWHPLTAISHLVDIQLFGLDGSKHILVNVVIHAINSALLFLILQRATRRRWPAAIVAALFALHPLHVESIAWASERKDVLSALFFFLTLWWWITWIESARISRYWLAVAACAASLLSKPMAVTMPFVLLLLDWWPFERPIDRTRVIEKWPFFALSVVSSLITVRTQHEAMGSSPIASRVANAIASYVAYLAKAFWPANLSIVYPYRTNIPPSQIALASILLFGVSAAAWFFRRPLPFLFAGWFFFLGTLVPVIGIVQIGHQSMADRYTYIPLIGIFIAIVWGCATLLRSRVVLATASAIVIVSLSACTFHQLQYWRSGVTLFEHAIDVVGPNRYDREGLARELLATHDFQGASENFRAALRFDPNDDGLHNGLGVALMELGDSAAAQKEFATAIARNPKNAEALRRLGDLNLAEGKTADAISLYERSAAIDRDPSTLAVLAAARGDVDRAVSFYRQAIAVHPDKAEIRNDLAAVLSRSGREQEALGEYQQALALDPHQYETRMNLGAVLTRLNRNDDATEQFTLAAQERPDSPEPHVYLALTYWRTHRTTDAVQEAMKAEAINRDAANLQFTSALHIPFRSSNLDEWIVYLRSQR